MNCSHSIRGCIQCVGGALCADIVIFVAPGFLFYLFRLFESHTRVEIIGRLNESPEETYRRLQSDIQRGILRGYPNPEARGCPGCAIVRNLAANPDSIMNEDEMDEQGALYRVAHGSPCYAGFLELRKSCLREAAAREP